MIHDLYWRIMDWLHLRWLDFDHWREMRRRRKLLRKWTGTNDWRRLK